MRDIKFRAWLPSESKMSHTFSIGDIPFIFDKGISERFELMHDIGKKDIKGKLIFDQDIVRIKYPNGGDFKNTIGRVFWDEDECNFYHGNTKGRPPKRMWEYAEVIGNVYQTPELWERIKKTL